MRRFAFIIFVVTVGKNERHGHLDLGRNRRTKQQTRQQQRSTEPGSRRLVEHSAAMALVKFTKAAACGRVSCG